MPGFRFITLGAVGLLAAACGGSGPLSAGRVVFWEIEASSVSYTGCPDSRTFADAAPPLEARGSFLVYRVSPDGTAAVQLTCELADAASCRADPTGLTWSLSGQTLRARLERSDPLGGGGCSLVQSEAWTMVVWPDLLDITVLDTLSLAGLPAACEPVEAAVKAAAPNGHGLAGCSIAYQLRARRR